MARPERWTVERAFLEVAKRLHRARLTYGHGSLSARDEAAILLAFTLRCSPSELGTHAAQPLGARERTRLLRLLYRRIHERLPAAYLVREAWLGTHRFYVDRRCIIPRSHIPEVLETSLDPFLPGQVSRVLDLCTGSGCLAILAALAFPRAAIDASDFSRAALAVARRNVQAYRLHRRVRIVHSDLFEQLGGKRYDLILCNPPYVTRAAMRRLPPEYQHEPAMALAGGTDGLELVRRLLRSAARHLKPSGILVCEVGSRGRALERAFPSTPFVWPSGESAENRVFVLPRRDLP